MIPVYIAVIFIQLKRLISLQWQYVMSFFINIEPIGEFRDTDSFLKRWLISVTHVPIIVQYIYVYCTVYR